LCTTSSFILFRQRGGAAAAKIRAGADRAASKVELIIAEIEKSSA
jgi:hypothetical protein